MSFTPLKDDGSNAPDDAVFRTNIGAAAASHTHAIANVTGLQTALDGKKADSMATNKLLGRGTAGTGAIEEITLGSNLSLSGTTLNAAGGTVDNAAVNAAIATNAAATRNTLEIENPVEFGHRINVQPNVVNRLQTYASGGGGTGSAPIRITTWGDSFLSGIAPPMNASLSGIFGLGPSTVTGTVTTQSSASTRWINRVTTTHAVGSTAIMSRGGVSGNWNRGDKCAVAYIKTPGGGSFDFQYESSLNAGTWVTLATINTSNASEAGGYNEYSLPTSNAPFFRLRIANVTTGSVVIVTCGIYCSDGGGIIWIPNSAAIGLSPSELNIPDAVFNPIWSGLNPDVVLTAFLETGGTEWQAGGGFRSLYDRSKVVKAATDWIMVGPHYCQTTPTNAVLDEQVSAMRDFALEKNETFFDSRPMFRTWAESNALGLMSNDGGGQHLSASGQTLRNIHLWHTVPMGRFPLGAITNSIDMFSPFVGGSDEPATVANKAFTVPRALEVMDNSNNGVVVWDMLTNPRDRRKAAKFRAAPSTDPNGLAEAQLVIDSGIVLRASQQLLKLPGGFALATPSTFTASGNLFRGGTVALCNATSGNITISIGHSAADSPGRIHIIKKTDSSANTVTVDPSGSETIDGATTYVMTTQYQAVIIQSDGSNWHVLSKF